MRGPEAPPAQERGGQARALAPRHEPLQGADRHDVVRRSIIQYYIL